MSRSELIADEIDAVDSAEFGSNDVIERRFPCNSALF